VLSGVKGEKNRGRDTEMDEEVQIVEDYEPVKQAKPKGKGREGSVHPSHNRNHSLKAEPKKRKLNVFGGPSAVPPMFVFGRSQV
jgi:hypothetical protein